MKGAYQLTEKGERIWRCMEAISNLRLRKEAERAPHHPEMKGGSEEYLKDLALVISSDYRIGILDTLKKEEKDYLEIIKELRGKFGESKSVKEGILEWHLEKLEGADLITRVNSI